jgi:hypothetical protein
VNKSELLVVGTIKLVSSEDDVASRRVGTGMFGCSWRCRWAQCLFENAASGGAGDDGEEESDDEKVECKSRRLTTRRLDIRERNWCVRLIALLRSGGCVCVWDIC